MYDAPVDAWYVWLGVGAVSVATFGVTLGLPAAAPPDATAVAGTIDEGATSPPGSVLTYELTAEEIRLDRSRVGLRNAGGTAHASVSFGPITPAAGSEGLGGVLDGRQPSTAFDHPEAFERETATARDAAGDWRRAPARLTIRRVTWEGVDALLVG